MSFKEASMTLDELYNELAALCEAKDNCESYDEYISYEVQIAELELEIEHVETFYFKYN